MTGIHWLIQKLIWWLLIYSTLKQYCVYGSGSSYFGEVIHRAVIKVTCLEFTDDIAAAGRNISSLAVTKKLQLSLASLFASRNIPGIIDIKILELRPGSLIVTFDIYTDGQQKAEDIRFILESVLEGGVLEDLRLSRDGFEFKTIRVDGNWSDWTSWTKGDGTCGLGQKFRSRSCTNPAPQYSGRDCDGEDIEFESYETGINCTVDGNWSVWTSWTKVDVTCGLRQKLRSRTCTNPEPQNGGAECNGADTDREFFNTGIACPVDGSWSEWTSWTNGNFTCGDGHWTRVRSYTNPAPQNNGSRCHGVDNIRRKFYSTGKNCPECYINEARRTQTEGPKKPYVSYGLHTDFVYASVDYVCEDGWQYFMDIGGASMCLRAVTTRLPWRQAREYCQRDIAHLVNVDPISRLYSVVNESLSQYIFKATSGEFWSGMHVQDGRLMWDAYGPEFVMKPLTNGSWCWASNQPVLPDTDACGHVVQGRRIFEEQPLFIGTSSDITPTSSVREEHDGRNMMKLSVCTNALPFVCQKPTINKDVSKVPFCPDDWLGSLYIPYCLRIIKNPLPYKDAKMVCQVTYGGEMIRAAPNSFNATLSAYVLMYYLENETYFKKGTPTVWIDGGYAGREGVAELCYNVVQNVVYSTIYISMDNCGIPQPFICVRPTELQEKPSFEVTSMLFNQKGLRLEKAFTQFPIKAIFTRPPNDNEIIFIKTPTRYINSLLGFAQVVEDFPEKLSFKYNITETYRIGSKPYGVQLWLPNYRTADDQSVRRKRRMSDLAGTGKRPKEMLHSKASIYDHSNSSGYSGSTDKVKEHLLMKPLTNLVSNKHERKGVYTKNKRNILRRYKNSLDKLLGMYFQDSEIKNSISPQGFQKSGLMRKHHIIQSIYNKHDQASKLQLRGNMKNNYKERDPREYPGHSFKRVKRDSPISDGILDRIRHLEYETEIQALVDFDQLCFTTGYYSVGVYTINPPSYTETGPILVRFLGGNTIKLRAYMRVSGSRSFYSDMEQGMFRVVKAHWEKSLPFDIDVFVNDSLEVRSTGSGAFASRTCNGGYDDGVTWEEVVLATGCEAIPVFSESPSTIDLKEYSEVELNVSNFNHVINDTVRLTDPDLNLTEADIIYTADILYNSWQFESAQPTILDDIYDIANNVLDSSPGRIDSAQTISNAPNRIIQSVEGMTSNANLDGRKSLRIIKSNLATNILEQDGEETPIIGLQFYKDEHEDVDGSLDNADLLDIETPSDTDPRVTDTAVYLDPELFKGRETRAVFQIYSKTKLFEKVNPRFELISKVAAAKLKVDNFVITDLGNNSVIVIFRTSKNDVRTVCASWDYKADEGAGGWTTYGCNKTVLDTKRIMCECNHLTNFAVLIDLEAHSISDTDKFVLAIVTKLGLIISIIGFGLTIMTFIIFNHLRNGRGQRVLINLAVSMMCSSFIFLVGVDRTESVVVCKTVAASLHYFILVSFMWMLIEGLLQYLRFVKVLGTYIPNFMLKTMIPAWGIPILPVMLVAAINHDLYYGGNGYCWLAGDAMFYGFIIPVATILAANILVFCMVMVNLLRRRSISKKSNQSERQMAYLHFKAAVSIFVVLGLTWVFGFLAIDSARTIFHYIFAILNAFQGFFIFLLFTVREKRMSE